MGVYRYRAATASGALKTGALEGLSVADVLDQLRRSGLSPIEAALINTGGGARTVRPLPQAFLAKTFGELAVILDAGVPMDRAIALLVEDIEGAREQAVFQAVHRSVREGRPLSRALSDAGPAFPSMAAAMTSAGEADGRPAAALSKLAQTLERAQTLQSTLVSAMIYPAMLMLIACGVIVLMLFWVVPQFEGLFSDAGASLPTMTRIVLGVSRFARSYWAVMLGLVVGAGFAVSSLARRPSARRWFDRAVLGTPQIGPLVSMTESARFVRVLSSLVEGGVALPDALAIARRSVLNTYIGAAIDRVAKGLREGEGLTEPLAATGVLPKLAISYLRTGEQTAQLPLMLDRLADALDGEVRIRVERLIGMLTPLITVAMGGIVAVVIASIMTAILGFDDLALAK